MIVWKSHIFVGTTLPGTATGAAGIIDSFRVLLKKMPARWAHESRSDNGTARHGDQNVPRPVSIHALSHSSPPGQERRACKLDSAILNQPQGASLVFFPPVVTHNNFDGHQQIGWLFLFAGQSSIRLPGLWPEFDTCKFRFVGRDKVVSPGWQKPGLTPTP